MKPLGSKTRVVNRKTEGTVAILVAFALVVLVAFSALVIDVGNIYRVRNELQNAADAAALAGARFLNGTSAGITAAEAEVIRIGQLNRANGTAVNIPSANIHFGHWDFSALTFTENTNPPQVNAIRIETLRSEDTDNPVHFFLAPILGTKTGNVNAMATGVGNSGPNNDCFFPAAIASCALVNANGTLTCPRQLCFGGSCPIPDNVGFALPESPVSGSRAEPFILDALNGVCHKLSANQTIYLQNGNDLSRESARQINIAVLKGPVYVVVPVVQEGNCSNFISNQSRPVTGFVRIQILGATWPNPKTILTSTQCNHRSNSLPGTTNYGLGARNVLVK
jgi:Flp pilus assembly protein TadG